MSISAHFRRRSARYLRGSLLLACGWLTRPATAQVAFLTVSPTRHQVSVVGNQNVVLIFSSSITSASATNIRLFGSYSGRRPYTLAGGNSSVLTLNPVADFRPGEIISGTVPTTVRGASGRIPRAQVFQFTAKAPRAAPAQLVGNGLSPTTSVPRGVALADIENDGDLDMLVANSTNAGGVTVHVNDGTSAMPTVRTVAVGGIHATAYDVAAGDLNGDGFVDFVASNWEDNFVAVRLNDGAGNFSFSPDIVVGSDPRGLTLGDVDGDGDLDMVVANAGGPTRMNTVSISRNNGSGVFGSAYDVSVNPLPFDVTLGDVDNDGDLDLLATSQSTQNAAIRLNNGTGTFSGGSDVLVEPGMLGLTTADVNGDGFLDLLTTSSPQDAISVCLNAADRTGSFLPRAVVGVGTNPWGVTTADLDGDGDLDLLASSSGGSANAAYFRLNDGAGHFSGGGPVSIGNVSTGIAAGDLDGDGDMDLACAAGQLGLGSTNGVRIRLNIPVPVITGFTPAYGRELSSVVISGLYFPATSSVTINGRPATFTLDSENQITATIPSNTSTGLIRVTTPGGTATSATSFRVLHPPSIVGQQATVAENAAAGTLVRVVAASDPDPGETLTYALLSNAGGRFLLDATTGRLTVAPGALLDYETTTSYTMLVRVTDNGPTPLSSVASFTVALGNTNDVPVVNSFSPTGGLVGTSVVVQGRQFYSLTGVSFNGVAAAYTVNSPTQLTTTVPPGAATGRLTVTSTAGTGTSPADFTVLPIDLVINSPQQLGNGPFPYRSISIVAGGRLTLTGPIEVTGSLTVAADGELATSCQPITGSGAFRLDAGATLGICDPAGITFGATGAIRLTGTRQFASDAVYRYDGTAAQVTGEALPATVRELVSANPAGLTLSRSLTIGQVLRLTAGVLKPNGTVLTLRSTATRTAYAVHAGGLTSGGVTVQRYVGSPVTKVYRHLSSPVQNTVVASLATNGFTPFVNQAYNALPMPRLTIAQFPNIFGFDEQRGGAAADFLVGYYSPTTLSDALTLGRGWTVRMSGNQTLDFVGTLAAGTVTQALTVTGDPATSSKAGWHLLGNPYAQPIDWDLATVPTGMSQAISVYRSAANGAGFYLTRANQVGTLPDGILPVGQGFFARVITPTASPVSFSFTAAMRVEANPATVARPRAEERPLLSLTLTPAGDSLGDETFVYAEADATAGLDARHDGLKPGRNLGIPTLATLIGGAEAAINGLPTTALHQPATVELLAELPAPGHYELRVGQLRNFGATSVELLDRLTHTRYDLTTHPVVRLTAQRAAEEVRDRFALIVGARGGVLAPTNAATLTLWPNPAHDQLTIAVPTGASTVQVLDAVGRLVLTLPVLGQAQIQVPLHLPRGVYVVKAGAHNTRLTVD